MASRPLLTPVCFYLCKGDLIKPQEKKKPRLGQGMHLNRPRGLSVHLSQAEAVQTADAQPRPCWISLFLPATLVTLSEFWWLCPRPWLWAGLIQVSLQSSPLAFEQPAYPEKAPGESSLSITAWWATCLWWCHLELGQSPITLSLTWPLPKTGTMICSLLINDVDPSFPDQPCCSLVN